MSLLRKWWRLALALLALVLALQLGASLLARTRRVHRYLTAQLEQAFGRPVEVGQFAVQLLPVPRCDAERITVGEDPTFGNEYFLRADSLSASLRWTGLLRGRFEFGALSLRKPSLILVRNAEGRWNLERWLPPAKNSATPERVYGPPAPVAAVRRLLRIAFDDGRVDFKNRDEKLAFALTQVSGSVDQVSAGRWQLQLEAQPWRSGVVLQSVGTLRVQGDLAGTSTRLQPATIAVRWDEVSLADLLRLLRGRDYGVRGVVNLNGTLKSGTGQAPASAAAAAGIWSFSADARAAQIHRWDLGGRSDNPRLHVSVQGQWNVAEGRVQAESIRVEAPRSNLRGSATYLPTHAFVARLDSAGVQAADLLAWYRAFTPGVDDGVSVEQFFTGAATIRGWPFEVESAAFSSNGGVAKIPAIKTPLRIGAVRGGRGRNGLVVEPVRISFGGSARDLSLARRRRMATSMENAADVTVTDDLAAHSGILSLEGHVQKVEDVLQVAAAFGHPLNHGWELSGDVLAVAHWDWQPAIPPQWNGRVLLNKTKLAIAGLNQPLDIQACTLNWKDGLRSVDVNKVNGFGGSWTGTITERPIPENRLEPRWDFSLTTDRMNASDLDRWVGPRARPNWLKRLLASLLGSSSASAAGSELLRQVNAEGELHIGELTVEKLTLVQVHVAGALRDLQLLVREAQARWAGGGVAAQISAAFAPVPRYDVTARLDGVDLSEMPISGRLGEQLAGNASGVLHVVTEGVGRDDLLQNLAGSGSVQLRNVEFRGWDLNASVADGAPHFGTSQWTSGQGTFTMRNRSVVVDSLTLNSRGEQTSLQGTVSFAREADLTIRTAIAASRPTPSAGTGSLGRVLRISGPLDGPRVSVEKTAARQPAD